MKILIACEESGTVRDAFIKRGHDAVSCDIIPTSSPGPHIQGDVLEILNDGWDMMIAFPPCTYLANAGLHYLKDNPDRIEKLKNAFSLVKSLYYSQINKVAIENPTGWLNTNWKKPNQTIQPYYFGEPELKTTCLWLKNLPPLHYRLHDDLFGKATATKRPIPIKQITRKTGRQKGAKYSYYWRQGKSAKIRSKTFQGIADAMAEQWG